jgi:hypothetical protein
MTNLARDFALTTMRMTQLLPADDFLARNGVAAPVPVVPGAIPEHARVPFPSILLAASGRAWSLDLLVIFSIGDFPDVLPCSTYYDPASPWYNVFYGAYGIRSHERDGSWWGYHRDGTPDFEQMLEVPELDYNFLTAAQLGCPPEKRVFRVKSTVTGRIDGWDTAEVRAVVPSGLHRYEDARWPNLTYYAVFGLPERRLAEGRESYEPVDMKGQMFFRRIDAEPERITLVWGAMCPDPAGTALLGTILDAMRAGF